MHGFEKQKYTVFEGESINITFGRDIKGASIINRLSLQGTIASEGDKNGEIRIHTRGVPTIVHRLHVNPPPGILCRPLLANESAL